MKYLLIVTGLISTGILTTFLIYIFESLFWIAVPIVCIILYFVDRKKAQPFDWKK